MTKARSGALYRRFAAPVIATRALGLDLPDRRRRRDAAVDGAVLLPRSVTVKLLPFDNKSEIAVVVDLPEGASLEDTERTLFAAADIARGLPEVTSVQAYAGTPAPFNFNGLVRHYYLRERPELGELQVNLAARGRPQARQPRHRARSARAAEGRSPLPEGTSIKVVEVPPGPPVLATLLAEIYGPDAATRRAVTGEAEEDVRRSAVHRRYRRFDRPAAAAAAAVDRPGPARILRRRAARRLRHHRRRCSAACRSAIRTAARTAIRSRSRSGCRSAISPGREALASTPVPANTPAGSKTVVELGEVVRRTDRGRLAARSSAATAASPTW